MKALPFGVASVTLVLLSPFDDQVSSVQIHLHLVRVKLRHVQFDGKPSVVVDHLEWKRALPQFQTVRDEQ